MLAVTFAGSAQCRLATDPDPYDEPRGVSGYLHAYAGEPDLDRLIRFQDPPFRRTRTPTIGVLVRSVVLDGAPVAGHPLQSARVQLLDRPKFEGRNGVVAEDGLEPIVPFHLSIEQGAARLARATVPTDPTSPYCEFNAIDFIADPGFMERQTGIVSLVSVWGERLALLETELRQRGRRRAAGARGTHRLLARELGAGRWGRPVLPRPHGVGLSAALARLRRRRGRLAAGIRADHGAMAGELLVRGLGCRRPGVLCRRHAGDSTSRRSAGSTHDPSSGTLDGHSALGLISHVANQVVQQRRMAATRVHVDRPRLGAPCRYHHPLPLAREEADGKQLDDGAWCETAGRDASDRRAPARGRNGASHQ